MATAGARVAKPSKRESIVGIAKSFFLKEGFSATSMALIAAAVGGSKATLYNHFPSKEDLFHAVIAEMCAKAAATFGAIDLEQGALPDALFVFGRAVAGFTLSDDTIALHRLIVAEAERFPELGRSYHDAGVRLSEARLSDAFERLMAGGRLRRADPAAAARQFVDMCLSDMYRRRLWNVAPRPGGKEIDANVAVAVEAFLHGYAGRPG